MKTVGIYLYNNVEVLDFAGPFEVFSTAQRLCALGGSDPTDQLFKVVTIAEKERNIFARGGLQIRPDCSIEYHPHLDVLVVPGGVVDGELKKDHVVSWIDATSERAEITASVCTGAFLLAEAGLLTGKRVTTHWQDIEELRRKYADIDVEENVKWVDEEYIVTSAGISAGIDMSLHLVSRLVSGDHAVRTARQMDYDWQQ